MTDIATMLQRFAPWAGQAASPAAEAQQLQQSIQQQYGGNLTEAEKQFLMTGQAPQQQDQLTDRERMQMGIGGNLTEAEQQMLLKGQMHTNPQPTEAERARRMMEPFGPAPTERERQMMLRQYQGNDLSDWELFQMATRARR